MKPCSPRGRCSTCPPRLPPITPPPYADGYQFVYAGGLAYGTYLSGTGETWSFTEAASLTSGTLSVVDGVQSASLSLLGNYVTSDFALSNDKHGGTFVKFV
jgi:hypothetical protein